MLSSLQRSTVLTLVLVESDGIFDNDELARVSLLGCLCKVTALYRCKSLSLETYGKYCLTALPLGPRIAIEKREGEKVEWKIPKIFSSNLKRVNQCLMSSHHVHMNGAERNEIYIQIFIEKLSNLELFTHAQMVGSNKNSFLFESSFIHDDDDIMQHNPDVLIIFLHANSFLSIFFVLYMQSSSLNFSSRKCW